MEEVPKIFTVPQCKFRRKHRYKMEIKASKQQTTVKNNLKHGYLA